jgi:hypothetical protein
MSLSVLFVLVAVSIGSYVVCGTGYVILGQVLLRYVRTHYPAEWVKRGKPTFVSFAALRPRWLWPFAARNFFVDREYRTLHDAKLTRWANIVRVLCLVKSGATISFPIIGLLISAVRIP